MNKSYHELELPWSKSSAKEGAVCEGHERGCLRRVEACELGGLEGVFADRRDLGGDHERARKVGGSEGAIPDLHERGRLRKVEARKLRVFEGGGTDGLDCRAHRERARELGVEEGGGTNRRDGGGDHERPRPDLHERGRLRKVEARELGVGERQGTDGLHGRAHLERAREVHVAIEEVIWDVRHGRVGELPARLRAARSDGALLQPGTETRETTRGAVSSAGAVATTGGSGSAGVSLT
eukprot:scaffold61971_cov54-Phaeocystis_antarctica.AAC.1